MATLKTPAGSGRWEPGGVNDRLLTAREVAERLSLTTETVLVWVRQGALPAFRLGRAIRFREGDLDDWLEQRATPRRGVRTTTPGAAQPATLTSLGRTTTDDEE
jgi:excisionase family DNA binding protein